MKSNVWYISKYANISKYGADTRQALFCREFGKLGYKVNLITSNFSHLYTNLPRVSGLYEVESVDCFEVTWIRSLSYKEVVSIKRVLGWLWFEAAVLIMSLNPKIKKPDVVIASSLSLFSVFSGSFLKFFFKAKLIFEVRDIWPQTLVDLKGASYKNPFVWLLSKIEKFGYSYADEIVGTMPGLSMHVHKVLGRKRDVNFIPQGVDVSRLDEFSQELPFGFVKKYIPKEKFIVTYTGTFGHANALEFIIDAAKIAEEEGDVDTVFLLVGDGVLKSSLMERAKGLKNVIFAPAVKKSCVQNVLSMSDVLVASVRNQSIYNYGTSLNKFIDYLLSAKPVICMYSGFPSLINESGCGEFTPAEDSEKFYQSILKLKSKSVNERLSMGQKGRDFLLNHRALDKLAGHYVGLFK
ncbi:MAG: glycosyltransferase WbuB [Gammaproteobacteria bacterium HGW-Gammaproteobacteria-15]|nr:MAG: glycosyltransferase WbuB [Gammaproteobacteria bacterium HGW-Gammaproteobacteria-15]